MKTTTAVNGIENQVVTLYMAMELSKAKWQLLFAVSPGQKPRQVSVPGGDHERLRGEIEKAKARFGLSSGVRVLSCHEAGRDGFWVHRALERAGVESVVVDAGSMRRRQGKRHRKTDRLDVLTLLSDLMRWDSGDRLIWSVVRVPSEAEEDLRRLDRERKTLVSERTTHRNRVRGLLVCQGVEMVTWRRLSSEGPNCLRKWDGSVLGMELRGQIARELVRIGVVEKQLKELRERQRELLETRPERYARVVEAVERLEQLRGIGEASSWTLASELYWREFQNRKQVGGYLGLCGTPYASGEMERDLGIGKDGPSRLRAMLVELAWGWLRFQPESKITLWFQSQYGPHVKRHRRKGIVAVARKLAVALWRYLTYGEIPEGAQLKPVAA
jgi:transposase